MHKIYIYIIDIKDKSLIKICSFVYSQNVLIELSGGGGGQL